MFKFRFTVLYVVEAYLISVIHKHKYDEENMISNDHLISNIHVCDINICLELVYK